MNAKVQTTKKALTICLLGLLLAGLGSVDLGLFLSQGKSWLGPALDIILIVFGTGLVVTALVATATEKPDGPTST